MTPLLIALTAAADTIPVDADDAIAATLFRNDKPVHSISWPSTAHCHELLALTSTHYIDSIVLVVMTGDKQARVLARADAWRAVLDISGLRTHAAVYLRSLQPGTQWSHLHTRTPGGRMPTPHLDRLHRIAG